jgi:hypothetical protein
MLSEVDGVHPDGPISQPVEQFPHDLVDVLRRESFEDAGGKLEDVTETPPWLHRSASWASHCQVFFE